MKKVMKKKIGNAEKPTRRTSRSFRIYIPPTLDKEIIKFCDKNGCSQAWLLREAVAKYLKKI